MNLGELPIKTRAYAFGKYLANGGRLTDEDYYAIMERVAQENYEDWGFSNPDDALLHALNDNTYNYKAFYEENPDAKNNSETHWTDKYKTVYHPTFSDESIYNGKVSQYNPQGLTGGHWVDDGTGRREKLLKRLPQDNYAKLHILGNNINTLEDDQGNRLKLFGRDPQGNLLFTEEAYPVNTYRVSQDALNGTQGNYQDYKHKRIQ